MPIALHRLDLRCSGPMRLAEFTRKEVRTIEVDKMKFTSVGGTSALIERSGQLSLLDKSRQLDRWWKWN